MTPTPALRSAIYEGLVTHHRTEPDHRFTQRVSMPLLFIDELAAVSGLHPLVHLDPARPTRQPHAVRMERSDFLGPFDLPIEQAVARQPRPSGGGWMARWRRSDTCATWGWLFNPLTVYYCFDAGGAEVEWTVLEVTNTPWHERHCYVIGPPGRHRVVKAMHVFPFLPMGTMYDVRYSAPIRAWPSTSTSWPLTG